MDKIYVKAPGDTEWTTLGESKDVALEPEPVDLEDLPEVIKPMWAAGFEFSFELSPEIISAFEKLAKLWEAVNAVVMETWEQLVDVLDDIYKALLIYPNKRVIHLATYHKSERVRKKNTHRIIKWMLKWMRYRGRSINGRS
jgi:hypothetical protein